MFSYFTDLQGSQTAVAMARAGGSLVTLLIYKVLKRWIRFKAQKQSLVTLLIYKVLKL